MRADKTSEQKSKLNIVVAIDGPAGAGKSTIARHLARHFGLLNLETGAMYRAFALKALRLDVPLGDSAALERLAAETDIQLKPGDDENHVLLDGEDVTGQIRNQVVTDAASRVSVFPPIRAAMVKRQQEMGAKGGVVMEGRDIGTAVFPDADLKVFLDADARIRAERRVAQNGSHTAEEAQRIVEDLVQRDQRDRTRAVSPLVPASDAVVIDSTNLTVEEALARVEQLALSKIESLN